MSAHTVDDYTFRGLCYPGKPLDEEPTSLGYLAALVDASDHEIIDLTVASRVLASVFDMDELVARASDVLSSQEGSLPKGYYPQTPVMITKAWSPVSAMLERSFSPVALRKDAVGIATGIWLPTVFEGAKRIADSRTVEDLFWAILSEIFKRATTRGKFVSIIAEPGWSYETSVGSLPEWSANEIAMADKILWKRTPEG